MDLVMLGLQFAGLLIFACCGHSELVCRLNGSNRIGRTTHTVGFLKGEEPEIALRADISPLIDALDAWGDIHVGDNEPYSGKHPFDYTVDHHAEAAGLACVGLEIRQNLIADPDGAQDWADLLARCLRPILANDQIYRRLPSVH